MLISFDTLKEFILRASEKTGVSHDDAGILADALITTDARNMRTHGSIRFPVYVKNLSLGKINPAPQIRFEYKTPATFSVDGDNGLGAVVMVKAIEEAMKTAETYGVAVAGVRNCNHVGACGYYADIAARNGYAALVLTEAVPYVAPFGSADPYFGTNPICIALPHESGFPVVADMATSVVSRGKITAAQRQGKEIPLGWALDQAGNPTTDANAAAKGVLLPFGAHKGSALALAVSYACGVLTGAAFGYELQPGFDLNRSKNSDIGSFVILVKCDAFLNRADVEERMDMFCRDIKKLRPAPGFEEVLLPGEPEDRAYQANMAKGGIEIDRKLFDELNEVARLLGIDGLGE